MTNYSLTNLKDLFEPPGTGPAAHISHSLPHRISLGTEVPMVELRRAQKAAYGCPDAGGFLSLPYLIQHKSPSCDFKLPVDWEGCTSCISNYIDSALQNPESGIQISPNTSDRDLACPCLPCAQLIGVIVKCTRPARGPIHR